MILKNTKELAREKEIRILKSMSENISERINILNEIVLNEKEERFVELQRKYLSLYVDYEMLKVQL